MTALLAALAGMLVVTGIVLALPTTRLPARPGNRHGGGTSPMRWVAALPRRTRVVAVVGVVAGLLAAALSGVLVLIVVVPAAVIGLPALLGKPDTRERDMLTAVEAWSRSLAAGSATGRLTLRDVIAVTRTAAPPVLRPAVDRLNARIATTWTTSRALQAFADELDSAWVDEVTVYLLQAADYSANGLAQALDAIANNLASQVKLRAEVYKERERPRRVMIQITGITGITLALVILFARTPQLAPYATPLGQTLLVAVLAVLTGLLVWARHIGRPRPEPRFLLVEGRP
jgi:archaellum biogenesis protein FlaJ (TadC family)